MADEPAVPPPAGESAPESWVAAGIPASLWRPEFIGMNPSAVLAAVKRAAPVTAYGEAAADWVLEHGTSPQTAFWRAAARAEAAGLSEDEVLRLAREAGEQAFALPLHEATPADRQEARDYAEYHELVNRRDRDDRPLPDADAARLAELGASLGLSRPEPPVPPVPEPTPFTLPLPEPPPPEPAALPGAPSGAPYLGPAPPSVVPFAIPLPEPTPEIAREAPPFTVPLPDAPAPPLALPADVAEPAAGVFGLEVPPAPGPADVAAPGAPPIPPPDAADPGSGGGTPPWWDPLLGDVVGAEPEPATPPWWDPLLGQVVEPGAATGRPPVPEAAPAPSAPGAGHLAEAAALAREAEGAGEPPVPADAPRGETRRGGRDSPFGGDPFSYAGRVLGRGLDELLGPGGDYGPQGGGETAGGGGMMEVLTRIAEGVERLIEVVSEARDTGGGGPLGPGSVEPTRDFGYDDDAETPASPSVDLWDLFRPGKARDAAGHPRAEAPKRQPRHEESR